MGSVCCCHLSKCKMPPKAPTNITLSITSTLSYLNGVSVSLVWDSGMWMWIGENMSVCCTDGEDNTYCGLMAQLSCYPEDINEYSLSMQWFKTQLSPFGSASAYATLSSLNPFYAVGGGTAAWAPDGGLDIGGDCGEYLVDYSIGIILS